MSAARAKALPRLPDERGVRRAVATPPKGGRIELVSVVDPDRPFGGRIAAFLAGGREGMYALVLRSDEPESVAERLAGDGIEVERAEVTAARVFGARLEIEPASAA